VHGSHDERDITRVKVTDHGIAIAYHARVDRHTRAAAGRCGDARERKRDE